MAESPPRVAPACAQSVPRVLPPVERFARVKSRVAFWKGPSRPSKNPSRPVGKGEWEPGGGEWERRGRVGAGERRGGAASGESPFKIGISFSVSAELGNHSAARLRPCCTLHMARSWPPRAPPYGAPPRRRTRYEWVLELIEAGRFEVTFYLEMSWLYVLHM